MNDARISRRCRTELGRRRGLAIQPLVVRSEYESHVAKLDEWKL